jgi:hypothetical protein
VSADVAKLLSDLLLRDLQLRRSFDWNWLLYPDSCSTPARALLEMAAEEGDRRLLRVLLICNLALSLGYDGVDVSAREGIKGLLEDLRDPPWPA